MSGPGEGVGCTCALLNVSFLVLESTTWNLAYIFSVSVACLTQGVSKKATEQVSWSAVCDKAMNYPLLSFETPTGVDVAAVEQFIGFILLNVKHLVSSVRMARNLGTHA